MIDLPNPKLITLGENLVIVTRIAMLVESAEKFRTILTTTDLNSLAPSVEALII